MAGGRDRPSSPASTGRAHHAGHAGTAWQSGCYRFCVAGHFRRSRCCAEIRNGLFRGLSVEFKATAQRFAGGVRQIQSAMLRGAGLVDDPEYAGSCVEVRGKGRRRVWL